MTLGCQEEWVYRMQLTAKVFERAYGVYSVFWRSNALSNGASVPPPLHTYPYNNS